MFITITITLGEVPNPARRAEIKLEGSFDALGSLAQGAGTATAFEMLKLLTAASDSTKEE
jgi:hypothetical protein